MYIIYIIYLFIYVYTVYVLDILRCICLGITTIPIQKTNGAPTIPMRSFAARKERDELSMAWIYTQIWVWVNTYRYIFSGMNIHLPAILGFTRYQVLTHPHIVFVEIGSVTNTRNTVYICV